MDPKLLPTPESLERARRADEIEIKPCAECGEPCTSGERALRLTAEGTTDWFHYWHIQEASPEA